MIRTLARIALLLALLSSPASAQRPGEPDSRTLDEVVEDALRSAITPGAVIAVVVRDSIAFMQAYGRTALDDAAPPLTADALFQAGALSELVNALAAAHLAHDGTLRMDAPLGPLIPELPRELRDVTLEQLLTHTGGVANQEAVAGRGGADDLGAAARGLTRYDRFAPGGAVYSFSTPGLALVGLVIERAAKRPYASAMRAVVLEPLGMRRSTFDFAAARADLTPGWHPSSSPDARVQPAAVQRDSAMRVPVRGFHATAEDVARLAAALLNDGVVTDERVLPAGVAASLLEPRADIPFSTSRSARGTRISLWHGRQAITVSGGQRGHGVSMHLLPAERIGVIALTNKSGFGLGSVADFVFRRLLGDPPAPTNPERVPADSSSLRELAAHAGSYVNGSELIEILVGDGLPLLKSDDLTLPVRALDDGEFGALIDGRVALRFRMITDGADRPYLWLGNRALARLEPKR